LTLRNIDSVMSRTVPDFDAVYIAPEELVDGYSAQDIFEGQSDTQGITFDDLISLPGSIGMSY
jgi:hypothetical protein